MATMDVIDLDNEVVGSVELNDAVFGVEVNENLLYQAVHHYRAGLRAGTHNTKTRSEVAGGGRKPWRQKGTGRARAGSTRSPLWRGGGTTHGPKPRDYSYHLPRKMVLGALRSALTAKRNDGALKVVREFALESHKTKDFQDVIEKLDLGKSVLIVDNSENRNLRLSSRNIQRVDVMTGREIHPYHLLGHETIVFTEPTIVHCSEVLS
jgi:large subunit ribosomal protein L4